MFERTKTIWRQLLRQPGSDNAMGFKDADERRGSARYPAQLKTNFKPAGTLDNSCLSGQIRNISLGGLNLVAKRPFELGEMLTIELPGCEPTTRSQVLACVVHCAPEGSDNWSLGCTFSRELNNDDLQSLGAKRERSEENEQRERKRFACNIAATYQLVAANDQTLYQAQVLNLSTSGIGLLVEHAIETGALLSVDLNKADGTVAKTMLACVVHIARQPEGNWALGCNFIRSLSEEDLKAIV